MDIQSFFVMYQKALSLYNAKEYIEAMSVLENFEKQANVETLQSGLLKCAILRDTERYVAELELINELLSKFEDSDDRKGLTELYNFQGGGYRLLGQSDKALGSYLQAAKIAPTAQRRMREIGNALFTINAVDDVSAIKMQKLYASYREALQELDIKAYQTPVWKHDKIHVGYMSADLRFHPVSQLISPFFFDFDQKKFTVYVYQLNEESDFVTEELRRSQAIWRDVAKKKAAEVAETIRNDEIDILFDLGGHTAHNLLSVFAYRPAKVHISGIGYFNSTGIYECDGFLSDVYCSDSEDSPYFTERLLRLPHTHFCYQPYRTFPEVSRLPVLKNGYITFGSFNNFAKVNDSVLILWREILRRQPSAHLLIKHQLMGTDEGRAIVNRRLIDLDMPVERIELRGMSDNHLVEYGDMDIALDTFPYTGGVTTLEALFMGVPVITLAGNRHGARFGVSFLYNLNLQELVANTKEEYVNLSVILADDIDLLDNMRKNLRGIIKRSPLMNGNLYMKDVECLYNSLMSECH